MKKELPIFLVLLLIVAVVVKKRFMVDMENETVQEIIQEDEKPIVQEVKPKEDLLGNAIAECVQMDIDRDVEPSLD